MITDTDYSAVQRMLDFMSDGETYKECSLELELSNGYFLELLCTVYREYVKSVGCIDEYGRTEWLTDIYSQQLSINNVNLYNIDGDHISNNMVDIERIENDFNI